MFSFKCLLFLPLINRRQKMWSNLVNHKSFELIFFQFYYYLLINMYMIIKLYNLSLNYINKGRKMNEFELSELSVNEYWTVWRREWNKTSICQMVSCKSSSHLTVWKHIEINANRNHSKRFQYKNSSEFYSQLIFPNEVNIPFLHNFGINKIEIVIYMYGSCTESSETKVPIQHQLPPMMMMMAGCWWWLSWNTERMRMKRTSWRKEE